MAGILEKLAEPDGRTMFALMDDAALRMNDTLVAIGERALTEPEHAALVETFKRRNATLAEQIKMLDARIDSEQQRIDVMTAEFAKRLDNEHRAWVQRSRDGWAKHSRVTRALTWVVWIAFWVSGYFAHGAVNRLTGWTW